MLIKVQLDATVCRHLFTATSFYMFRVSPHPSSGVLKTVSATSGVCHGNGTVTSFHRGLIRIRPRWKEVTVPLPWHTPEVADTVFITPDDGCVTPEPCRVTWQWINVCILLHRVGPLLTLNHDARNHVFKIVFRFQSTICCQCLYSRFFIWPRINNCTILWECSTVCSKYFLFSYCKMFEICRRELEKSQTFRIE